MFLHNLRFYSVWIEELDDTFLSEAPPKKSIDEVVLKNLKHRNIWFKMVW